MGGALQSNIRLSMKYMAGESFSQENTEMPWTIMETENSQEN